MNYSGRSLNPIALWEQWVEFPNRVDDSGYAPLVQCPNPDHNTDKKHFQINLDAPLVHCFANCGISGTYEHAIAMILGIKEREARKEVLKYCAAGKVMKAMGTKRKRRKAEPAEPVKLHYETFIPQFGMEYLESREISGASISSFGLGWDSEERRLVIPGRDEKGTTRFLIRRAVRAKDYPKYLYSEGSDKTAILFGACNADRELIRSSGLVLCEGSLDCIRLHQNGVRNAVAILGSGLSRQQALIIDRLGASRVFMMFDKDVAGIHAAQSVVRLLKKQQVFICRYPKGKSDPAELTGKEAERSIERAMLFSQFQRSLSKRMRQPKEAVTYG